MFKSIHQSVENQSILFKDALNRRNYVTPTSFLELLKLYKVILVAKRKDTLQQKDRLSNGLTVLAKAAIEIEKLNK